MSNYGFKWVVTRVTNVRKAPRNTTSFDKTFKNFNNLSYLCSGHTKSELYSEFPYGYTLPSPCSSLRMLPSLDMSTG